MIDAKLLDDLKNVGIFFDKGLSKEEIEKIETIYNFKFPNEIKEFYSLALPIGSGFHNWRDFSESNINRIINFQRKIEESFLFDIENNNLLNDFKEKFKECKNNIELKDRVLDYLKSSPKLIPFYEHRCFISGIDNMPIISFWQPTDSVFYGSDFENYLRYEFLKIEDTGNISKNFKDTGIWYDVIS